MAPTTTSSANDRQVGGSHYKDVVGKCPHCQGDIQHWDLFGLLPYLVGCATKYVTRFALKNGKEDLVKAKHYIDKLIERYYPPQLAIPFEPIPWQNAGGPNECEHGYAQGLLCVDCWRAGKTNGVSLSMAVATPQDAQGYAQGTTPEPEALQASVPDAPQASTEVVTLAPTDLVRDAWGMAQVPAGFEVEPYGTEGYWRWRTISEGRGTSGPWFTNNDGRPYTSRNSIVQRVIQFEKQGY